VDQAAQFIGVPGAQRDVTVDPRQIADAPV
jgi:hypothetical protein